MRVLLEPRNESACSLQGAVEIVDAEEQEQAITGGAIAWTHQRRMRVRAPLMEAEQHSSVRIDQLTKIGMPRIRRRLAK